MHLLRPVQVGLPHGGGYAGSFPLPEERYRMHPVHGVRKALPPKSPVKYSRLPFAGVRKTVLCRDRRSGKPYGADCAVTGRAKRRDRATKSQKPNGMGAADERLQGTGRGDCEV